MLNVGDRASCNGEDYVVVSTGTNAYMMRDKLGFTWVVSRVEIHDGYPWMIENRNYASELVEVMYQCS